MPLNRFFELTPVPYIRAVVLLGTLAVTAGAVAQAPYHIVNQWKIGGEGGWDYLAVDPSTGHLYVTHGPRVEVIDTSTGKSIGAITGLKGTHGVAFDEAGKLGYISDGGANAVVIFDRTNLQTLATVPAGTNPDGIAFEPATKTVWAFNGRSKDVTVIDTATRKTVATIPLPGKPEFPSADGKGTMFVNIEDKNEIVRLDASTHKITATWPLAGCESPSGLALDIAGGRLFSVCDGHKMVVTDSSSGKQLASPVIGEGPDATAYDPKNRLAFSSNGEGSLTVVDVSGSEYRSVQTLQTKRGARTMALDQKSGRVYLVTADFGPRPAATPENPRPRPAITPGSFSVLVVSR